MVIIDTPVWSEALRRNSSNKVIVETFQEKVQGAEAILLGPVRQELLSGIREKGQYEKLRLALHAFPDLRILVKDYELAAHFYNQCRKNGIQGSNTDFLICAVASRLQASIFTLDQDFSSYAQVLPIKLVELPEP
jgi:predicted nucleic acid-binding protein